MLGLSRHRGAELQSDGAARFGWRLCDTLDLTASMRVVADLGGKNGPRTTPTLCGGRRCPRGVPMLESSCATCQMLRLAVFSCLDVRRDEKRV
jgi:hypothetical protein